MIDNSGFGSPDAPHLAFEMWVRRMPNALTTPKNPLIPPLPNPFLF
jgi:hypothetical protein